MRDLGVDRRRVRRALLEAAQAVRIDPEAATVATLPLVVGE
jgi:hypothetical protein